MKTKHPQDAATQARRDRIDAYLAKQKAFEGENRAAKAEQAGIEAADRANRAAEHRRTELEKAKANLENARLQRNILLENLPRAQAEVARIPANAPELVERWKVFCSDPHGFGVWRQLKQGALIPGEDPPVPPGFSEDPCPTIKLFLEAPAQLKDVVQKLAYFDAVIDDIKRTFPEALQDGDSSDLLVKARQETESPKFALGARRFATGRS